MTGETFEFGKIRPRFAGFRRPALKLTRGWASPLLSWATDLAVMNLAFVLAANGAPDKALAYAEQSLSMNRMLYPNGHPELVVSVNSMSRMLMNAIDLPSGDQAA